MRHPISVVTLRLVMDDRLWYRSRKRRRRKTPKMAGWYEPNTHEIFVVLYRLDQCDVAHSIASTVLHELIHASSSRSSEKRVCNVEDAMMNWVMW